MLKRVFVSVVEGDRYLVLEVGSRETPPHQLPVFSFSSELRPNELKDIARDIDAWGVSSVLKEKVSEIAEEVDEQTTCVVVDLEVSDRRLTEFVVLG